MRATETGSWLGVLSATVGSRDLQKQGETPPQGHQSRPTNTETHTQRATHEDDLKKLQENLREFRRVEQERLFKLV